MLEKFYPDILYESIYEIDFVLLKERGITGLIFDIDNTLVKPSVKHPDKELTDWLANLEKNGFKLCILSNSRDKRSEEFSKGLNITTVSHARKPSKEGFLKAVRMMGLQLNQVCMIGDQLFTDVYGAKRLGIYAVYTKPFVFYEVFTVMLKRLPEAIVFKFYYRAQRKHKRNQSKHK